MHRNRTAGHDVAAYGETAIAVNGAVADLNAEAGARIACATLRCDRHGPSTVE